MRTAAITLLFFALALRAATPPDSAGGKPPADSAKNAAKSAAADTVIYSADVIRYERSDSMLVLIGHAELKNKGMSLKADTIYYRTDIKRLEAAGNPVLLDGAEVVVGERMVYLLNERRGKIQYGTSRTQGDIYNGEAIARMDDETFLVKNGDFSTCDNDSFPHYFFFSKKMKVLPHDKAIAKPVVLNIGDVPVGIFPFFIFPIKHGRQSGLLTPRWGQFYEHGNPNAYLNNVGYYFALSDYTDLETKMDFTNGEGFFFKRIFMEGNFAYAKRYLLNGFVHGRMETTRGDQSSSNEWGLSYSHNQTLLPDESFYLRGSGELAGNSNYYRQSTLERTDYLKRELNSNMALVKTFKDAGLSTNMEVSYNQNLDTKENSLRAPSLSLNSVSRPIIPSLFVRREDENGDPLPLDSIPWYGKINWGYNMSGLRTQQTRLSRRLMTVLDTTADTTSHLHTYSAMDMRHNFSFGLSQNPSLGYLNIIPRFGLSSSWFFKERQRAAFLGYDTAHYFNSSRIDTLYQYDTVSTFKMRQDYNLGADFNTRVYGVSKLNVGRLLGFRHVMDPSIGYTFSPELKGGENLISAGNASAGNRDLQQAMNFGLGNTLQAKLAGDPADKNARDDSYTLLNFNVGTNYNFTGKNLAGKTTGRWGGLSSSASTNLYTLNLSYSGAHTFYNDNDEFIPTRKGATLAERLPRLQSYSLNAGTGANLSGKFSGGGIAVQAADQAAPPAPSMNPWSLGLNFSYNYNSAYNSAFRVFETASTFSLRDNLTLKFTDNWTMTYSSIYDFKNNELVDQSMNLSRDFHCWEAVFNWVMNGYRAGFYFRIGIKAIPDVKFEKRGGEYGGYYGSGGFGLPGQGTFY